MGEASSQGAVGGIEFRPSNAPPIPAVREEKFKIFIIIESSA
jgi:hypothetical protein